MRAWADGLDEPTIVYVEACEENAVNICRYLHTLRLAGWFDRAAAVLVGKTYAPDHVPPHLPLVNGALARVVVDGDRREITQTLA